MNKQNIASELLNEDETIVINSTGNSMFPLLKNGDKAIIVKLPFKSIVKGDIIITNCNGTIIGHRVVSIINTNVITRGDNCLKNDEQISSEQVLGKVQGFIRNGKPYSLLSLKYRFFNFLILYFSFFVRPIIRFLFILKLKISKAVTFVKNTISNITLITKDSKKLTFQNTVLSVLQAFLPFLVIYLLKRIIDLINKSNFSQNEELASHLELLIAVTGFVFLANLLVNSIANYVREKLSQSISLSIYSILHNKHSNLDFKDLEDSEKQDEIHRATVEAGFRPNKLVGGFLTLVRSIISGVIILFLMFKIHWIVVIILILGLLPGLFLRFRFSKKIYNLNKKNSGKERQAYYYNRILTATVFAKELRLFSTSNLFSSRFNAIQTSLNDEKNAINRKQLYAEIFSQTIAITLIFVSFAFVTNMAIQGKVTIGTVVLFFLVFQRGFVILKELFQSIASLFEDNIFFADFISFIRIPTYTVNEEKKYANFELHKGISIENVSFQYPSSSRLALYDITMNIPVGKTIALVGANGSGKSTLVKLLCGFYEPTKGSILFDEKILHKENKAEFRKEITAVFQDFALYNMTAAENIWLGKSSDPIDYNKIKHSGKNAGIDESIEKLPLAYQNMIGNFFEKGEELSIGQWQKMAIARAFYRNSNIVIMDEPSSALDAATEIQLIESLRNLAKNKTVLIISHRFSTIQWVDNIYVLDNGTIIESGSHDDLITKKGKYFDMYSLQKNV